jgi:molybdopterin synthase catalytic subunit
MGYLSAEPLGLEPLVREVAAPEHGALATFLGLVRDHHAGRQVTRLEYQAYGPMAEAECGQIVAEAERRWACRVALRHRTGVLAIGEAAVAIAVGSGHRAEAFEACRFVIEELKRRVPIWKREAYADGSEAWVDPTAPDGTVAVSRGPAPS